MMTRGIVEAPQRHGHLIDKIHWTCLQCPMNAGRQWGTRVGYGDAPGIAEAEAIRFGPGGGA